MDVGDLPVKNPIKHNQRKDMARKPKVVEPVQEAEPTPEDLLNESFDTFNSAFEQAVSSLQAAFEEGMQGLSEAVENSLNNSTGTEQHTLKESATDLPEDWQELPEVVAYIDSCVADALEEHEEQIEDAIAKAEETTEKLLRKELEKTVGKDSAQKIKTLEKELAQALKQIEKNVKELATPRKPDPELKYLKDELAKAYKENRILNSATEKQLIAKAKAVNFAAVTSFKDIFDILIDDAVENGEKDKAKTLKGLFKDVTTAVRRSMI